jgi:glycosyltransferase involved in cell wall biosynthesis
MNVLFVDCVRELGGPQRSLLELATALAADGVSVHAAVPAGPLADALRASAIAVREIPAAHFHRRWGLRKWTDAGQWFRAMVAVGRVARSIQPDILHANDTVSATIAAQYRRNRIVVWHIRGLFVPDSALHYLIRRVTAIVAISEAVEENLTDRVFSFQRGKIHLFRNGIDANHYRPGDRGEARRLLGLPPDAPLVGMIANLSPWKRHSFFLDVVARVHRARSDVRFVLAGWDPFDEHQRLRTALQARIAAESLTDCVLWLPEATDSATLLPALDIVVHPAAAEAFGRVICEAMAAEIPVVAANDAGPQQIISHGKGGYLLPPVRADLFAEQILLLLANPDVARQQGIAARKHILAEFDIARTAREVRGLYAQLMEAKSRDARRTREEKEERRQRSPSSSGW